MKLDRKGGAECEHSQKNGHRGEGIVEADWFKLMPTQRLHCGVRFLQAVNRFSQRVFVAVSTAADRRLDTGLGQPLAVAYADRAKHHRNAFSAHLLSDFARTVDLHVGCQTRILSG